jgi:hypothetical protein
MKGSDEQTDDRVYGTRRPSLLSGADRGGRVIFYVADVDALYERALAAGAPRDAGWGERFST